MRGQRARSLVTVDPSHRKLLKPEKNHEMSLFSIGNIVNYNMETGKQAELHRLNI